ncbi:MAG: TIGR03118 family protein [Acidobacteriaceae bacterium]|nr:TIGR03118 family protein [Acidobacteriaceae bacterium]MBV8570776.1 TIGR03118 family protein [Acidobacteriaceae bacterium]
MKVCLSLLALLGAAAVQLAASSVTYDADLKNPWGMSFSATSPIWVSNQGSNTSTLYTGDGTKLGLVVTVPPTTGIPTGPTGQVFSGGAGFTGSPFFIFDTLAGTIDAWGKTSGTTASVVATTPGAIYTGLGIGAVSGSNFLYAANFVPGGGVDVYNTSFTMTGTLRDSSIPSGYSPFNSQVIGGKLYVEYAKFNPSNGMAQMGAGLGYVAVYDLAKGTWSTLISGGQLNAPWGVTLAPKSFGAFSNDLLIGNFGNGEINAYSTTGVFLGTLSDGSGHPLVNPFLWAIEAGNNNPKANPSGVYFNAGIGNQVYGLFGVITASSTASATAASTAGYLQTNLVTSAPEPAALGLMFVGGLLLAARLGGRRKSS